MEIRFAMMRLIATLVLIFQYIKARLTNEVIVGAMVKVCANGYDPLLTPHDNYTLNYYISLSPPPSVDDDYHDEMFDDYGYPDSDVYHYARSMKDVVGVVWKLDDETWHVRSASLNTALVLSD